MVAFRDAVARGCTGLESDIHVSADGVPMLVHDPVIRRGLRRIRIANTPASELEDLGVVALRSLYAELGSAFELSLDLKHPGAGPPTLMCARAAGDEAERRLWLCASTVEELTALRQLSASVKLVHSVRRSALGSGVERHAAQLASTGLDAMNMHRSDWSLGLVTLFHRFEVAAFAWDVQDVRHLRLALDMQVDGIYSDHVDRMVAVVAEWSSGHSAGH
jgi:glycerophosphoryl diester phosphodiesterase